MKKLFLITLICLISQSSFGQLNLFFSQKECSKGPFFLHGDLKTSFCLLMENNDADAFKHFNALNEKNHRKFKIIPPFFKAMEELKNTESLMELASRATPELIEAIERLEIVKAGLKKIPSYLQELSMKRRDQEIKSEEGTFIKKNYPGSEQKGSIIFLKMQDFISKLDIRIEQLRNFIKDDSFENTIAKGSSRDGSIGKSTSRQGSVIGSRPSINIFDGQGLSTNNGYQDRYFFPPSLVREPASLQVLHNNLFGFRMYDVSNKIHEKGIDKESYFLNLREGDLVVNFSLDHYFEKGAYKELELESEIRNFLDTLLDLRIEIPSLQIDSVSIFGMSDDHKIENIIYGGDIDSLQKLMIDFKLYGEVFNTKDIFYLSSFIPYTFVIKAGYPLNGSHVERNLKLAMLRAFYASSIFHKINYEELRHLPISFSAAKAMAFGQEYRKITLRIHTSISVD